MTYRGPVRRQSEADKASAIPSEPERSGFRGAMRELASGVSIVTCGAGERRAGCAVTALTSLSLSPPSLLVCLDLGSTTLRRIREVGIFAVNLLGASHERLAARFAGHDGSQGAARFDEGEWIVLVTGAPILADALASIDCRVEDIRDRHSHAIVIGAALATRSRAGGPALLHWRTRFETLA